MTVGDLFDPPPPEPLEKPLTHLTALIGAYLAIDELLDVYVETYGADDAAKLTRQEADAVRSAAMRTMVAHTVEDCLAAAEQTRQQRAQRVSVPPPEGWTQPTTYLRRFGDAMALLCSGHRPSDAMMSDWLDPTKDSFELQGFAVEHRPAWAQGITVIEAARVMAEQPTEGV